MGCRSLRGRQALVETFSSGTASQAINCTYSAASCLRIHSTSLQAIISNNDLSTLDHHPSSSTSFHRASGTTTPLPATFIIDICIVSRRRRSIPGRTYQIRPPVWGRGMSWPRLHLAGHTPATENLLAHRAGDHSSLSKPAS